MAMETLPLAPARPGADEPSGMKVACVHGTSPCFSDQMICLLRTRLRAVSLVLTVGLGTFTVLFLGEPLLWLRLMVLGLVAACYALLRSPRPLSGEQLKIVEMAVFGGVGAQLVIAQVVRMSAGGAAGDPVAATSAMLTSFTAWIILMMLYAIFVPSTPKHSAVIAAIATAAPLAVTVTLVATNDGVAHAVRPESAVSAAFGLLLAAAASVYGTHTVSSLRREAFQAKQFGQYRLREKLGAGGMGEVYEAEHRLLKRPCAIKLIRPGQDADPTTIGRFEREVQAMASLSHWNTVDVYDYGRTEDGTFYYVMELLPGASLDKLVRRHGPLPAARAVHFLRQVCGALEEAHGVGLIHRDVKPANIIAARRGGLWDVAKLLDFGLVKEHSLPDESAQLTQPGTFSGSPQFMAPEQATRFSEVDARCDIYSLGAVAYCLLAGRAPFLGDSPMEIVIAHSRDVPVPPSEIEPGVPADVEKVVLRCLEKKPADRYPSAAALGEALSACASAGQWTQAQAAEWWQENEPETASLAPH